MLRWNQIIKNNGPENKIGLILNSLMRIMCCIKYNLFKESYLRRDIMKKFALTTLAVMAAVGVLAVRLQMRKRYNKILVWQLLICL